MSEILYSYKFPNALPVQSCLFNEIPHHCLIFLNHHFFSVIIKSDFIQCFSFALRLSYFTLNIPLLLRGIIEGNFVVIIYYGRARIVIQSSFFVSVLADTLKERVKGMAVNGS